MRFALYARYSSDLQRAASIEDQVAVCTAEIERRGGTLVEAYTDAALSGASRRRPGLEALLADARAGRFDVVVAEALDRLSRDQEDVAALYKRLAFAGVTLVTLSEGEIGPLHIGLKGTMNALYLTDLADKVRRGQRGAAAAGRSAGGLSYGYKVVKRLGADGELQRGERAIDDAQAAVIREIFARYAAGESPKAICHDLNRRGLPAPRGDSWRVSSIIGHKGRANGILHNPLYRGELVWNRVRMVKDPESGKRISRVNPAHEWVRVPAPALRIVEEALWQAAQARRRETGSRPLARRARARRLLSGLLRCGCCGGAMVLVQRGSYGCSAHRDKGTCDNGRSIKAAEAEARVLAAIKDRLLTPERVETFVRAYQARRRQRQAEAAQGRRLAEKRLAECRREIERLVDKICAGTDSEASNARLMALDGPGGERQRLEAELAAAPDPRIERLHPDLAGQWRRLVECLEVELRASGSGGSPGVGPGMLQGALTKVVVIPPALEAGRQAACSLELHGNLATILELASSGDPAGRGLEKRAAVGWTALVAGEGLEPPTRGL